MITNRCVPLLAAASLVGWSLPVAASATPSRSKAPSSAKKHKAKTKKGKHRSAKKADQEGSLHGVVPPALTNIFSVLKGPAAKLPASATKHLTSDITDHFGIDVLQARLVSSGPVPFYLVPGKLGVCLVLGSGGSACTAGIAQVAVDGLSLALVDPPANPDGSVNTSAKAVGIGIVPDDVTAVTATTVAGHTFTANVVNNGYQLTADGPFSTTLTRAQPAP